MMVAGTGIMIGSELGGLQAVELAVCMTTGLTFVSLAAAFLIEWLIEQLTVTQRREAARLRRQLEEEGGAAPTEAALALRFAF